MCEKNIQKLRRKLGAKLRTPEDERGQEEEE
jgi:hypothetical protein